jgi:RimJ/RimL family protein N-acetyltransferase
MVADRVPEHPADAVELRTADPGRDAAVWRTYQRGLHEVYAGIGASDLALGPEAPAGVTTVVLAASADEVVGGILLRAHAVIPAETGSPDLVAAVDERRPEGVHELGGCWIRPGHQGTGVATALAEAALRAVAGSGRWTVALANQFSVGVAVRVGFVPDERFRDLPFPDGRFRSTLCWFDHRGEVR